VGMPSPLIITSVPFSHLTELHAACDAALASVIRRAFCNVGVHLHGRLLIFYSTPAVFFCDATMYIYEDSTALEPHYCSM